MDTVPTPGIKLKAITVKKKNYTFIFLLELHSDLY